MISLDEVVKIPGWMTRNELEWLREMALRMPPGAVVVEIGSWMGRSTAAIAVPHVNLICVDTWGGIPGDISGVLAKRDDIYASFVRNMRRLRLRPRVLPMDCAAAADLFPDASLNWVFEDSDHPRFRDTFYSWLPKLAPGWIMSGHDYGHWAWPVITETLLGSGLQFCVVPDTLIWYLRK